MIKNLGYKAFSFQFTQMLRVHSLIMEVIHKMKDDLQFRKRWITHFVKTLLIGLYSTQISINHFLAEF